MRALSPRLRGLEIWWAGDSRGLVGRALVSLLSVAALSQNCRSQSPRTMGALLGVKLHGLLSPQHPALPCPGFRWRLPLRSVSVSSCLCASE